MRMRMGILGMVVVMLTAPHGQGVAPPLSLGKLTPAQEKQINAWWIQQQIAAQSGKMAEALRLARQVHDARQRWSGKGYWETVDARFEMEVYQRLTQLSEADQKSVGRSIGHYWTSQRLMVKRNFRDAEPQLREALAISKTVVGEEHPFTADCYKNVANCLQDQGKAAQALPLFEKSLELNRKILGEEHPNTAFGYNNVAKSLEKLGKQARRLALHEKALAIRKRVLGEDHPDTGTSYGNVAGCLSDQGKAAEALTLYEKALANRKRVLGDEHPNTANSYNNVAIALEGLGKTAQALPRYEKALAIWRKAHGEKHPNTAKSYHSVARCLDRLGKTAQSLPLHEKALAIRKIVFGEEHPDTGASYSYVAVCLQKLGRTDEAFLMHKKVLVIRKSVLGEEHPSTAICYDYLGQCLQKEGKVALALPLHEKALAIHKRVLGEEHPDTLLCYNNVASCLQAQGKVAQALLLHEKVLSIRRKVLGENHRTTADCYNNLAGCLQAQGDAAQALPLYEKALAIYSKMLGEDHPDTARGYNNVAFGLYAQGKEAQALPLFEKFLTLQRKRLGEDHPDTARGYNNVAFCLISQGKAAQATPLYEKALAIRRKVLGEDHPATAHAYNNLAKCLNDQGKHREAIRHWKAALLGHDVGRLMRSSSGFQGAAFETENIPPRLLLTLAHAGLGEARLGWEYAESALGRGLLEDLAPTARDDKASIAEVQRLDERLVGLVGVENPSEDTKTQLEEVARQRRAVLTRLNKLAAARSAERVWSLERIQKQLADDTALLYWISDGKENWACVVRTIGPPRWQRLEGSAANGSWSVDDIYGPNRLHELLARPDASSAQRERLTLSLQKQWFAPVRPHLAAAGKQPAVKHLIVVPTRFMSAMPVELLAPDLVVSYAPSGTIFAQLATRHRALSAESMLALGDPAFAPPARNQSTPPAIGLFVRRVLPDSNAERAGLREGDVLLRYDVAPLASVEDLRDALKKYPKGQATFWRDGKEQSLVISGPLGTVLDQASPAKAMAAWRERNASVTRGETYDRLPGTRVEVEALSRLVGKGCRTLLGSDASEQSLDALARDGSLAKFRILHFATHGQVDLQRPEWTSLILSRDKLPTNAENLERIGQGKQPLTGELKVETILRDWKLDADLVVLSACQTGLGQKTSGDGLLGFSQALLQKDARSIILSRWQVADDATALLMLRFYENLLAPKARKDLKKPMPRAEALAEAKKWLRELPRKEVVQLKAALGKGQLAGTVRGKVVELNLGEVTLKLPPGEKPYAHPYYWAAFVLIGDPD